MNINTLIDLHPGNKVFITFADHMSKEEHQLLRKLKYTVTIEELDIMGGFYSVEFPGYLFDSINYT